MAGVLMLLGSVFLTAQIRPRMGVVVRAGNKKSTHDDGKRTYFPVTPSGASQNKHTHVEVMGKVELVKREQDGDTHIRISDGKGFIVAECIPKLPCTPPKVGQVVVVRGIFRQDYEHKWFEVHPVEELMIEWSVATY